MKQQLNKLKQHQNLLIRKYLFIKENYFLLEPLLYSNDLADRISSGPKARGFHLIKWTLYCNLFLEAWKIACDDDNRTPSIRNQIKKIEKLGIKSELEEQYSELPSDIDEFIPEIFGIIEKKKREKRRTEFQNLYKETLLKWRNLEDSGIFNKIQTLRDKYTAHNEVRLFGDTYDFMGVSIADLKYGDERKFLERLQYIIVNLDLLIRQSSFDWEDFDDKIRKSSLCFWDLSEEDYRHKLLG